MDNENKNQPAQPAQDAQQANQPADPANQANPSNSEGQAPRRGNWITDMYDKMNVPVKVLDAMLIILGLLIVFLFIFGNKIQLGI